MTAPHLYLLALGGNRRTRFGTPAQSVAVAAHGLAALGKVEAMSAIGPSAPVGPARRRFANAALILETPLDPPTLLGAAKAIERAFGRRPGARWGDRALDIDIVLWSAGAWRSPTLTIPHRELARRAFVLGPALSIAPGWHLPGSPLGIRHLHARLTRRAALSRSALSPEASGIGAGPLAQSVEQLTFNQ